MITNLRRLAAAVVAVCSGHISQAANQPGQFDYYLLSLSWSPQYCSTPDRPAKDPEQCGPDRRLAFVVHGLWPNNERAPHPRNCAPRSAVPTGLVKQMLAFMPSPRLIQHQWEAHGTCSGVNVEDYYSLVRTAFRLVNIPDRYRQPDRDLRLEANEIRRDFQRSNASFPAQGIKLDCAGQFLREVRVCFDENLAPRACSKAIQDTCGSRTVTMRKVR
jgi:ribonuclease T2